jgi:hypothetical protein
MAQLCALRLQGDDEQIQSLGQADLLINGGLKIRANSGSQQ